MWESIPSCRYAEVNFIGRACSPQVYESIPQDWGHEFKIPRDIQEPWRDTQRRTGQSAEN